MALFNYPVVCKQLPYYKSVFLFLVAIISKDRRRGEDISVLKKIECVIKSSRLKI